MSVHDPIADCLTAIRNAQMMGITSVITAYSKIKQAILVVLEQEGYIVNFEVILVASKKKNAKNEKKNLKINLKYYEGQRVIEKIKRLSRPGLRVYRGYKQLSEVVPAGFGIAIISTPLGVLANKSAYEKRVGGEVLCIVE